MCQRGPLSFYYFFLVYFQDYKTEVCFFHHHFGYSFIQIELDTVGFHGPVHVQKGQFCAKPKFTRPCLVEWVWGLFLHSYSGDIPPSPADVCRHSSSPVTAIFSCGFKVSHSIQSDFWCLLGDILDGPLALLQIKIVVFYWRHTMQIMYRQSFFPSHNMFITCQ